MEQDGLLIAERIRKMISELELNGKRIPVTASIGLGVYPHSLKSDELNNGISTLGEILFKNTDAALYEAKHSGRNQVCIA